MTLPERNLWRKLRKLGLNFRRQAPIGRYIVDFAFHAASLVIEVDGPLHDLPEKQQHDVAKDAWLRSEGYRVLRFRNVQVMDDLESTMEAILRTLPARWGKGRDGAARTEISEKLMEAPPPLAPKLATPCQHPLPCPCPIEGEGA